MTFIPDLATIAQFAIATFVIAITPGPDMTLFVGRALSQGRAAGFACMAGAMSGVVVHTMLVALGLSALIVAAPAAFLALKIAGAVYLLFLAWQAVTKGAAFSPETKGGPRRSLARNWLTGFVVNLMNPKIILFFMTFLPQFVTAGDPDAPGKLLFLGLLFIVLGLPVVIPILIVADRFAMLLRKSRRVARTVDFAFAGVFSAFALKILTAQAR